MRVTSEFFVSSLIRKVFGEGQFGAVTRKGAAEAGAILIVVDKMDGSLDLYAPAPQAMFLDLPQGRLFEKRLDGGSREAVNEIVSREERMDPDFWVVEIESKDGVVDIPIAPEETGPTEADKLFRF